jgi:hypothetical protein
MTLGDITITKISAPSLIDILKNIVLACDANGLRDLPFVRDARQAIERGPFEPVSDVIDELRKTADMKDKEEADPSHFLPELLRKAAETIEAMIPPGKAAGWETPEEAELERQMFHACGRQDVPDDVRALLRGMWSQYCLAAGSKAGDGVSQAVPISDDIGDGSRQADELDTRGGLAPVQVYRVLKRNHGNGTLDGDHLSALAREIAALSATPADPKPLVVDLEWEKAGEEFRGVGPLVFNVYPDKKNGGWWAALTMAGHIPFRKKAASPEAAIVAAQVEFESRILAGLATDVPWQTGFPAWQTMESVAKTHGTTIIGSYDEGKTEVIQTLYYSTFDHQWRRKLDGVGVPEPSAWMPYPPSRHETSQTG